VEGDTGTNSIELHLAVGGKELIIQIKAQEDGNKEGREGLLGKSEAIKIVSKLGEGVTQGGAQFEDLRLLGEGEAIGEEGDGAIHHEKFVHSPYQGVAVAYPHGPGPQFWHWG